MRERPRAEAEWAPAIMARAATRPVMTMARTMVRAMVLPRWARVRWMRGDGGSMAKRPYLGAGETAGANRPPIPDSGGWLAGLTCVEKGGRGRGKRGTIGRGVLCAVGDVTPRHCTSAK